MDTLMLALTLAVIVERLVNAVKSQLGIPDPYKWVYAAIGWVLGVAFAFAFGLDVFAGFGHPIAVPTVAVILTGLVIGGGSNITSDVVQWFRAGTPPAGTLAAKRRSNGGVTATVKAG